MNVVDSELFYCIIYILVELSEKRIILTLNRDLGIITLIE